MNKVRVAELIFPVVAAWYINKHLSGEFKKAKEERDNLVKDWLDKISTKKVNDRFVEKMASEIYDLEIKRKATLEKKATSLLAAVGFVISLISVALVVAGKDWIIRPWTPYALFFFGIAIFHFITSGTSATRVLKVGEFFQLTTDAIKDSLRLEVDEQKQQPVLNWTVEKLVDVEINYSTMLIKSNWLDASQGLFLRGLYSLGISFVFVALNFF